MVEKIIINPEEIRGYGNIIIPHVTSDYDVVNASLESGTDTVNGQSMTVYELEYAPNLTNTVLSLSVSPSSVYVYDNVVFTAVLEDEDDNPISGATVTFKEGDTVLGTDTTDNTGEASLTLSTLTAGSHSVTANYSGDSTYAGSNSSSVSVTVSHSYSLSFSSSSYVATGGSATLSMTLLDNSVAVSGETISVTGSDSSVYSGLTNNDGTASVTVSNISSETTFTASYSGATATCTVTVQSYLFYDDCSSSSGLSNYGSLVSLESATANANLTYDSTENAYALTSLSSSIKAFPITLLDGLDDFKLSFEFRTPSTTQKIGLGLTPMLPSTHTGIIFFVNQTSSGRESVIQIDKNHSETYWGDGQSISNYNTSNYYKLELIIDGDTATWNLYDYNNTLLRTYNYTLSNITTDYNTLSNRAYGIAVGYQNDSSAKMYIKNIKAEAL